MKKILKSVLVGAGFLLIASVAQGDLVTAITTLNNSTIDSINFDQNFSVGIGFDTGNLADASDWSISVAMGGYPAAGGTLGLWWANPDGSPGGELRSIALPSSGGSALTVTRADTDNGSGTYELNPNFKYLLVFEGASSGGSLQLTANPAYTTAPAADASWKTADHFYLKLGGNWSKTNSRSGQLAVSVASIPEPATVSLIGLAGISMITVHRLRRRHNEATGED